jgi:predicted permease
MLLTGAGLLIRAFVNAVSVEPGFDPENVVTARIVLPTAHRNSDQASKAIQERLTQALGEIPGISSVALSFSTPFRNELAPYALTLGEDPRPPGSPQPLASVVTVTPGYLETMRLQLVEGRFLEAADAAPGRQTFVVDESFARKFFAGRSAVGGRFTITGPPGKDAGWPTIVGVVRDVPHNGVEDRTGNPFVYQLPQWRPTGLVLFVRTARPVADVIAAMREKLRGIDPTIPLFEAGAMEATLDASFDNRRALMLLLAAFAGLALFLAALGIYGVLAYDVSQRTREIGIRAAIGATRGQVVGMILQQGLWRAGVGLLIGLIGARLLSRTMTSLLFEVKPTDPMVYGGVSVLLLLVAALASYLPARRAAKVNPMIALRCE